MSTTIMLVDDDEDTIEILRLYLAREGYSSVVAFDGLEALKSIKKFAPDLVILDVMLPRLDGLEVCRHIREESQVPIVMLTARLEEETRRAGFSAGANDYISKPFSPNELMSRLKAVLERTSPPG